MKSFSLTVILFCLFLGSQAQNTSNTTSSDTLVKTKPQLKLSINYNSRLNYYGRIDSLKSSGLFPMLEFWATRNFYVNAAPIFVNNATASFEYAGTVATAGYQHLTKKWLTNLYVLKPFYKVGSDLAQSVLKAQTGVSVSRLNKILNITMGGDVKFTDGTDFGATAGVDHIIRIQNKDNSVLVFDPAFSVAAGTQRFSRVVQKRNPFNLPVGGGSNQQTKTASQFNILSYEASVPIIYAKKKWMLLVTPSYVVPQNLVTVPNRPDLSERGENTFYTTVGLKYSF